MARRRALPTAAPTTPTGAPVRVDSLLLTIPMWLVGTVAGVLALTTLAEWLLLAVIAAHLLCLAAYMALETLTAWRVAYVSQPTGARDGLARAAAFVHLLTFLY